jgi:hypothetical protein
MDETTKHYRTAQVEKLYPIGAEYRPSLQLSSATGKTFWLSLSEKEFKAIVKILTGV